MRRQLFPALVAFVAFTVLTGIAYPLAVTGVAQIAFPGRAGGSLIRHNGQVVGSRLIGQEFTGPRYFHPRPSAAGEGYDAMASGPSNLGPTNPELLRLVRQRRAGYEAENGAEAPVDAVTASGSGLDPQISPANARLQAPRVARARGLALDEVLALVDRHTSGRSLGFLGESGVNVLELNLALDEQA
jgi:K+-transporting ATPase ATPase C chain